MDESHNEWRIRVLNNAITYAEQFITSAKKAVEEITDIEEGISPWRSDFSKWYTEAKRDSMNLTRRLAELRGSWRSTRRKVAYD